MSRSLYERVLLLSSRYQGMDDQRAIADDVFDLVEALKRATSTVQTHAMQTYSKVSARDAEEFLALIAKVEGRS